MPETPLPAGATVRPAAPGDAETICALLNEVDALEIGAPQTDLHEVEADLARPGTDLAACSWLGFQGDRLVCYGLVGDPSGADRIDLDHYVLPDHQELGFHVLELMTGRAADLAARNGADRAVLHLLLNTEPTTDTAALAARGWRRVRRHHVLTRAVSPDADPIPVAPPGVTVRTCEAEEDRRAVHALLEESFAEHFDHHPTAYGQWRETVDAYRMDWSLVWIAAVDGLGDAAVLVGRNDRESMGWVHRLGVLKQARGRGLGGHLLRLAFAAFAERGRTTVGLGVDTENATGALRLYEGQGMAPDFAVDTWELTLPAG
jgi:ribosomal protein S18 acetylase RimI-like enzyme